MNARHAYGSDNRAGILLSAVYRALCDSRLAMSLAQQAFSEHEYLNGPPSAAVRNAMASILVAERSLEEGIAAVNHQRELGAATVGGRSEGQQALDSVERLATTSTEPSIAIDAEPRTPQQGGIE